MFISSTVVRGALKRACQSRLSSAPANAALSVELSAQGARRDASVTDEMDEVEVSFSLSIPGDSVEADNFSQQQADSLSAELGLITAEEYTQDFTSELSTEAGTAETASFGVEPSTNSASAPAVTTETDPLTPSPTPSPTVSPGGVSGTGDPHLQNINGQKFDLMKEGMHVLINVPRKASAEKALLRVQADARRAGGRCSDMYFQVVNVTGSWAEAQQAGGYQYSASRSDEETPKWVAFGKVDLKVVHGRTESGFRYLNVYVKHLKRAGFVVGGLLGEDDHEYATIPPAACHNRVALAGSPMISLDRSLSASH